MANIFVFGHYAALNFSKRSKTLAKTELNLSFGLKPGFTSALSFGIKL